MVSESDPGHHGISLVADLANDHDAECREKLQQYDGLCVSDRCICDPGRHGVSGEYVVM